MPTLRPLALAAAIALPAQAGPLALSDTPLQISTVVEPNVMLLVDNSLSMRQIIWHEDYDPQGSYDAWQYCSQGWSSCTQWSNLNADTPTYTPSNFRRAGCSTGFSKFRRDSTTKCLKLPAPGGSNSTWYMGRYVRFLLDHFPNNADLTNGAIPNDYRMNVARKVAKDLVQNTPGMRFGLANFNYTHGGHIAASCGTDNPSLVDSIDELTPSTFTPLAESLFEITRYFRGLRSFYNNNNYTSPIRFRCQRSFTVVITDGLPTYDGTYPEGPNDTDDPDGLLPNWDGVDNDGTGNETLTEGAALFLDDIANFAWDIDMRTDDTDAAGVSFDDPQFPRQNMHTYTVGFTVANQMLEDAAEYGHGQYYTANDAEQLTDVLQQALRNIQTQTGSAASAAASTGFVSTGTRLYFGGYNSADWSGDLVAFDIESDRTSANYGRPVHVAWRAAEQIPVAAARTIVTQVDGEAAAFDWDSFEPEHKDAWFQNNPTFIDYIRGTDQPGFRPRASRLGDIIHSAPVFVGAPNMRYPDGVQSGASYDQFKRDHGERPAMIYVGANDGMLHGFDAETGRERLAYVPEAVLPELRHLADTDYRTNHRYFVDGSPTVADAYIGERWRTVLVGGLNKGGQSVYALDVTEPQNFAENVADDIVLWEFTDPDLGYSFSQPAIVRLRDGTWAAVFGNGYNNTEGNDDPSATGNAVLFVVDLATGTLIRKLDTGEGPAEEERPNGLATVAPVDDTGNRRIDFVYAGDLFGNLWRFNLGNSAPASWSVRRLFLACSSDPCDDADRQPITSRPSVIRHPTGRGRIVLFGTGQYLEPADKIAANSGLQSFYGIWDEDNNVSANRGNVLAQSILSEQTLGFTTPQNSTVSYRLRATTSERASWSEHRGWVLDLVPPSGTLQGERQITHSIVRNGRVIFTTLIPSEDPCRPGGDSWLMELNAASGGRLTYAPFDLNLDRSFTIGDHTRVGEDDDTLWMPPSGLLVDGGATATPAVLVGEDGAEYKQLSTASGLRTVRENPGPNDVGRQSWREIVQ
ncbi:MAG: hypothetical protein H2060_01205 [Azoarcus sp.]|nr:hypothetical protein [Azoarcus sp.]